MMEKVGGIDNYRPIAMASILSKVLEKIILDRLSDYINTTDNHFGFKPSHSTDMCIYALKEAKGTYKRQGSSMLVGFLDASKVFDRVQLFNKLKLRGVPSCIVCILAVAVFGMRGPVPRTRWHFGGAAL